MDPAEVEQMAEGDTAPDAVYRWTIRSLYAAAILLNLWVMWDLMSDEAEKAVYIARAKKLWNRCLAPFHREETIRRETGPMIYEAMRIVEEATPDA